MMIGKRVMVLGVKVRLINCEPINSLPVTRFLLTERTSFIYVGEESTNIIPHRRS